MEPEEGVGMEGCTDLIRTQRSGDNPPRIRGTRNIQDTWAGALSTTACGEPRNEPKGPQRWPPAQWIGPSHQGAGREGVDGGTRDQSPGGIPKVEDGRGGGLGECTSPARLHDHEAQHSTTQ